MMMRLHFIHDQYGEYELCKPGPGEVDVPEDVWRRYQAAISEFDEAEKALAAELTKAGWRYPGVFFNTAL
jgi:hypothetical protein